MAKGNGTAPKDTPLADMLLDLVNKVGQVHRGLDILANHFARHLEASESLNNAIKALTEHQKTLSRRVARTLKGLKGKRQLKTGANGRWIDLKRLRGRFGPPDAN
jgi:hypothetical protein